jgi:predicted PurR-regulated permease PerM
MTQRDLRDFHVEDLGFAVVVIGVTLAFFYLLGPYSGAILWAFVGAVLFEPMTHRAALRLGGRRTLAAAISMLVLLAGIVVPAIAIGIQLAQEVVKLYTQIESGQIDVNSMLHDMRSSLPESWNRAVASYRLDDLSTLREMLGSSVTSGIQSITARIISFGSSAVGFFAALGVMLYLLFFLLRDGRTYGAMVREALPLKPDLRDELIEHFLLVIRATMKGTVVVAIVQGLLGGIVFSLLGIPAAVLWGVLMGFFSLIPALGTAIVWVPVAGYLLATGAVWQGVAMILCGVFIIGLVDNLLRPILVGRDTRLPDFVVLIATLAGLELFGLTGFVVGPVIAALFLTVWRILSDRRNAPTPTIDRLEAEGLPGG